MKNMIKMTLVSFTIFGILIADGHLPGENHHDGGPHHSAIPKDQITIDDGEIILTHHKFGPDGSIEESHEVVIYLYPKDPQADMENMDEMDQETPHGFWQEATDNEDMQPPWSDPMEIDQFSIDEHGNLILAHDGEDLIVNLIPMMHHGGPHDGPHDGEMMPPMDGDMPPTGGNMPPMDGDMPPMDGEMMPPMDGEMMPPMLLSGDWWAHPADDHHGEMSHDGPQDGPHDEFEHDGDMTPVDHVIMGLEGFMEDKIADGDLDEGDAQYMATIVENLEDAVHSEKDGQGDDLAGTELEEAIQWMDENDIDEGIKDKFMNELEKLEWQVHNEYEPTPPPFELIDLDGDELISQEEAKEFLGPQYSDARWDATDVNGDAIVDPDEFAVASSRPPAPTNHYDGNCAALCLGFDEYFVDANGDGWANTSGDDMDEGPFATWEEPSCECPE